MGGWPLQSRIAHGPARLIRPAQSTMATTFCVVGATRGTGLQIASQLLQRHCHVNRKFAGQMTMAATASRRDCRLAPCQHSVIAKHAQGSAGGQMALDVEHIVDGGVD